MPHAATPSVALVHVDVSPVLLTVYRIAVARSEGQRFLLVPQLYGCLFAAGLMCVKVACQYVLTVIPRTVEFRV